MCQICRPVLGGVVELHTTTHPGEIDPARTLNLSCFGLMLNGAKWSQQTPSGFMNLVVGKTETKKSYFQALAALEQDPVLGCGDMTQKRSNIKTTLILKCFQRLVDTVHLKKGDKPRTFATKSYCTMQPVLDNAPQILKS